MRRPHTLRLLVASLILALFAGSALADKAIRVKRMAGKPMAQVRQSTSKLGYDYASAKAAAAEVMRRFPPGENIYVGVGRSPSELLAFLRAAGGEELEYAFEFPVSGIGHGGNKSREIDAAWPDYQKYFAHYLPSAKIKGAKRVLVIDATRGPSTENFRYAVRKYLDEEGVRDVEVETYSVWHGTNLVNANPRKDGFVFRGGVDHRFKQATIRNSNLQDHFAAFTDSNPIGPGGRSIAQLEKIRNPINGELVSAIAFELTSDNDWDAFVTKTFPNFLDATTTPPPAPVPVKAWPAKLRVRATANSTAPVADALLTLDDASAKEANAKAQKKGGTASEPETYEYASEKEYQALGRAARHFVEAYPVKDNYFVGLGRSSAPLHALFDAVGDNLGTYLPADGLSKYTDEGGTISGTKVAAFYELFDAFIPQDALHSGRNLVLYQKTESGRSLPFVKALLENWLQAKGSTAKVKLMAVGETAVKDIKTTLIGEPGKLKEQLGTRKYNLIAPYDYFRPGSSKNKAEDIPHTGTSPKPPRADYFKFVDALAQRFAFDTKLQQQLGL